eukprot:scaffold1961_cov219-Alexandrium_tamarense.AAC.21
MQQHYLRLSKSLTFASFYILYGLFPRKQNNSKNYTWRVASSIQVISFFHGPFVFALCLRGSTNTTSLQWD